MLTGQLGDVMKESAQDGDQLYPFGKPKICHCSRIFLKNMTFMCIFPEGAVPKDGPSAGITMAVADALGNYQKRKSRADLAMTGEVTLRGRVLAYRRFERKASGCKERRE